MNCKLSKLLDTVHTFRQCSPWTLFTPDTSGSPTTANIYC